MGEVRGPVLLDERRWAVNVASHLREALLTGRGARVTWYNHASVLRSIDADVDVSRFDHVGIDGFFLRWLAAPGAPRTSADLVLPVLLGSLPPGARVALIGSRAENLAAAKETLEALPSAPVVVFTCDGFEELLPPARMSTRLRALGVDVVVLGLGAPRQDSYLLELVEHGMTEQVLVTAGGWLDQVSDPSYYPPWAYRLKMNWLFRVLREPGRLWRRYTVEAVRGIRSADVVRSYLREQGRRPYEAMVAASLAGAPTQVVHVRSRSVAM
ncbi:WecB/TagA/CpsF family glycosyltransferase [Modestobacter excelsi]|uniref:WecB/TagA/CpsF family glycosyltransferase n=1 Tax=Modestobacter excelsi TaxID=2213161 RepID=UPI001C20CC85|nr:WecB/TagA/CpsF family glycosyltransferase [Modestobacter excelsi]